MADSGIQTAENEGEYLLPEAHLILQIWFWTESPTIEVDYRSSLYPARQIHAGWIATASGTEDTANEDLTRPEPPITWSSYFDFQSQLIQEPSGFAYDDRVMWHIPAGITAKFIVYW